MHRSTLLFFSLTVVLAAAVGATVWQLLSSPMEAAEPKIEGLSVDLGLPSLSGNRERREFAARSALLYDPASDSIAFEQNGFERVPIASITKLMTAMVAIDHGIDWEKQMSIERDEYVIGGKLLLHPRETVTMRDLFYASLLGSANNATLAFVRGLEIDQEEFVREMNRKAVELGLEQTRFADVTGLDEKNISTAYEVARLAAVAFSHYPEVQQATAQAEYSFVVGGSGREHTIRNTNKLVSEEKAVVQGSKTGYLYEAGYCLVMQRGGEDDAHIGVILGSKSEQGHLIEMEKLLNLR